jgi:preprotein translocase subunit YajC
MQIFNLLFVLVMLGLMWVLLIRPQRQRVAAHQALVSGLQVGDEVITSGGIVARIVTLADDHVMVEIASGVEVRLARGAVAELLHPSSPGGVPQQNPSPAPGDNVES